MPQGVQATLLGVTLLPGRAGMVPRAGRWVLDAKATLLDLETTADIPTAPYPGLVTLGATENGDLLLADFLHTGALLLDGTADDVLAVGRAMALEAGTCGWTDHTEIMTVGLGTAAGSGRSPTCPPSSPTSARCS
ncbi:hypothetical protein [Streptomyces sp. or20]|uniref:hypothetical protein n=1 Tax=Streptomyces sp. or20 TaxID=1828016 RepID=UPI000BF1A0EE|nr:hypothetical protein [Streptomyces sp. or20]